MPFDPSYPTDGQPFLAEPVRQQLLALKALIDAITPPSSAQVDGVTTLPPGVAASVTVMLEAGNLRLSFALPSGEPGQTGAQGPAGPQGETGSQGPAFAIAAVESVVTLDPGTPATAQASLDGNTVRLQFGLPRGNDGAAGAAGAPGAPGEVSFGQMQSAISSAVTDTSRNSNGMMTLDTPFTNDPPTLSDLEALRAKMNELIQALRRF
jgi:hypothetical protein